MNADKEKRDEIEDDEDENHEQDLLKHLNVNAPLCSKDILGI